MSPFDYMPMPSEKGQPSPENAASYCEADVHIPQYLRDTYTWAYLHRLSPVLLDRGPVVSAILWGNYRRLVRAALEELGPGLRVLQPACVYGDLSRRVALTLGSGGHLDVCDVVPLQLTNCRRKLRGLGNVSIFLRDAGSPVAPVYDAVCCFFLLHEMPAARRRQAVGRLLRAVKPGGRVVFVDYHKPHWANPLSPIMWIVLKCLEPFAMGFWAQEIEALAGAAGGDFVWSKTTYFGGLYQKIVARRVA